MILFTRSRLYRRLLAGFFVSAATSLVSFAATERPKLVVVISIDQFRADYLTRFAEHFGPDGFNLFLQRGANFANNHYRHSHTKTGCGHAVMLTGVHANVHGIIANEWADRNTFVWMNCVEDADSPLVGCPAKFGATQYPTFGSSTKGRSPKNLLAPTVGDALKEFSAQSKVIGISNKDRSAILMSGRRADAAYFLERGNMVSSTYYFKTLPDWVKAWNAEGKVEAYFGRKWERLLPVEAYAIQGPDDAPGEDIKTAELGNTLPKTVTGGDTVVGERFLAAVGNTPFVNEVVLDFAKHAIAHEQLGARGVTDLLCVSFSAQDYIGHMYGPDSHEVMDNAVRMDRILAELFKYLDEKVGLENCTLALTADHGVSPMPERVTIDQPGVPAGRSFRREAYGVAERALNEKYGPLRDGSSWLVRDDAYCIIHPSALEEKKLTSAEVQRVVRDALLTVPLVHTAYTRAELEAGEMADELGRMALRSFNRERSGDVYLITKPYFYERSTGSNHGSPYEYDTHVPQLWYGVGVTPGTTKVRTGVDDLAPTLAHILGLPKPPQSEGKNLFEAGS